MNLGFLFPAALIALGALLIPLAIHLARRAERRVVLFAALRWLEPKPRPRAQWCLDELLLLAVRLGLLAIIALGLAQPVLWNVQDHRPMIAVMPALGRDVVPTSLAEGHRAVWLAPGFPPLTAPVPTQTARASSLLRQLDAQLPRGVALDVFVTATLDDADADRLRLSRAVRWRVLPDPVPAQSQRAWPPPALVVRYAPDGVSRVRYFRAAAQAWAPAGASPAFEADTSTHPIAPKARYVIWLAPGPLPETLVRWVQQGGVTLLAQDCQLQAREVPVAVWQDGKGAPLMTSEPLGAGRVLRLQRPLTPAAFPALLEPDFPRVLARILQAPPPPTRVRAVDYAPAHEESLPVDRPFQSLQAWFALSAALMFLLERWLATRAKRVAGP